MGIQTNDGQLLEKCAMLHIGRMAVKNCSWNFIRCLTIESQMWFRTMRDFTAEVTPWLEWHLLLDKMVFCDGCEAKSKPLNAKAQSCNTITQHTSLCFLREFIFEKYLLLWCDAMVQSYRHFGENCCLHILVWNYRQLFPSKCLSVSSRWHNVMCSKMVILTVTNVRTSDLMN